MKQLPKEKLQIQSEKQIIEMLVKRLNDLITKNDKEAKKAALIIQNWLNKSLK